MIRFKKLIFLSIAFLILLGTFQQMSFAANSTSGNIDYVLIKVDDSTVISVAMPDYNKAKRSNSVFYKYLLNGKNTVNFVGVASGEKYILLEEYTKALRFNNKNIAVALEKAVEIKESVYGEYYKPIFNRDGTYSLERISTAVQQFRVVDIY